MCLPPSYQSHAQQHQHGMGYVSYEPHSQQQQEPAAYAAYNSAAAGANGSAGANGASSTLTGGLADLELTREEVVQEVLNAPKRRVDNEISRLTDSVSLLQMHLHIVQDVLQQYKSGIFRGRLLFGLTTATSVSAMAAAAVLGMPVEVLGVVSLTGIGSTAGMFWWQGTLQQRQAEQLVMEEALVSTFRRLYARRLAEKDEFTLALWARVLDHLALTFTSRELIALDKARPADFLDLEKLLEIDIPNLRRKAAPTFNTRI